MPKAQLRPWVIVLIAAMFIVPLLLLLTMIEVSPVCVDPNATIEPDRILNCQEWKEGPTLQLPF